MSIMTRRFQAIEDTIAQVRAAEAHHGAGLAALAEIRGALIALAAREELFPADEFTLPDGAPSRLYRLAEDADHRFAVCRVVRWTAPARPASRTPR